MNKNILNIKQSKIEIRKNKKALRLYFEKTFPNIITQSLDEVEEKINDQLEILLCSSLKNKTTRIELPISGKMNSYYTDGYYITRESCLNYKGRSYGKDLFQTSKQSLKIDSDLNFKHSNEHWDKTKRGTVKIMFSVLKDNKLVDQKKLMDVLRIRKKAVKIQNRLSFTVKERYNNEDSNISLSIIKDKLNIDIYSRGFKFKFPKLTDYRFHNQTHENFETLTLQSLSHISNNWNVINEKLKEAEIIKGQCIEDYKLIIKKLETKNRAFLVLKTLSQK